MIHIPNSVFVQYEMALKKREIPSLLFADYKKWLRCYLDFCVKHVTTGDKSERKQLFLNKLGEKKQTNEQMKQAAHAVSLYFEMQRQEALQEKPVEKSAWQQSSATSPTQEAPAPTSSAPKQQQSYRFNFDDGKLLVHGKGKKDRTVPIPEAITQGGWRRQITISAVFLFCFRNSRLCIR
jgi:hypothetical protein